MSPLAEVFAPVDSFTFVFIYACVIVGVVMVAFVWRAIYERAKRNDRTREVPTWDDLTRTDYNDAAPEPDLAEVDPSAASMWRDLKPMTAADLDALNANIQHGTPMPERDVPVLGLDDLRALVQEQRATDLRQAERDRLNRPWRLHEGKPDRPECRDEYTRPGGRQHGDRSVCCGLLAWHDGDHEETDTGNTWPQAGSDPNGEVDPDPRRFLGRRAAEWDGHLGIGQVDDREQPREAQPDEDHTSMLTYPLDGPAQRTCAQGCGYWPCPGTAEFWQQAVDANKPVNGSQP